MPRVSVILPNFNHGRFLRRRLHSILQQTFTDFELIFLDDGSTDDSLQVFAEFADDPRIRKTIVNDRNSGVPARQWNRGVREAEGRLVWIAESDDEADPRFLETLIARLDAHPTAGIAYCRSQLVDDAGRWRGTAETETTRDLDPERWDRNYFNRGVDECRRYLAKRNTIANASAVVFRREVYEAAGYADESLRYCSDWLMWAKMLMISDIVYVSEPLNRYRRHAGAFSRNESMENRLASLSMAPRLARLYPALLGGGDRDLRRHRALSYYGLGRLALRTQPLENARDYFRRSLALHGTAGALAFWAATYCGRSVPTWLDAWLERHPRLRRVLWTIERRITRHG